MDSEDKIIIAFIFKRSGKKSLTESELYLPLSLELKWFSTQESRKFVTTAVEKKLLQKQEGTLIPAFNIDEITIPLGFKPTKKPESQQKIIASEKTVVDRIVEHISQHTKQDHNLVFEMITKAEHEKKIHREVAALLIAQKYDLSVQEFLDQVETSIFKGNKE